MSDADAVRELLLDRGCPASLAEGGLPGLVARWAQVVASVEDGYTFGLDDLLNDMDVRDLIADVLPLLSDGERAAQLAVIEPLDARLRAVSSPVRCLWGRAVERDDELSPDREWWFYLRPTRLNAELGADLAEWDLQGDGDDDV
jgi:hypothetical protein